MLQLHVWLCINVVFVVQRYPVVMSTYLGILGRVLLQNSSFFYSLLTQMASECSQKVRCAVRPSFSVSSAQALLNVCEGHNGKVLVKRESLWTGLNVTSQGIANGNIFKPLKFRVVPSSLSDSDIAVFVWPRAKLILPCSGIASKLMKSPEMSLLFVSQSSSFLMTEDKALR